MPLAPPEAAALRAVLDFKFLSALGSTVRFKEEYCTEPGRCFPSDQSAIEFPRNTATASARTSWRNICWSASRPARGCSARRSCCARRTSVRIPPHRARQPARLVPRHLAAQEGAGAARRRHGVAVRVERDRRISRRDDRAAAAPRRSGRARREPRLDRLCADLCRAVTATGYAEDEAAYKAAAAKIPLAFERLERALEKQGAGPFFNGAKYSLVDAAYAPFLQRYFFLDRVKPLGRSRNFRGSRPGPDADGAAIDPFLPRPSSRRCTART